MRKDRYIGPIESQIAATNLRLIIADYERLYEERCPVELIDTTELGDRYLGPLETQRIAFDINSISRSSESPGDSFLTIISIVMGVWVLICVLGGILVWLEII